MAEWSNPDNWEQRPTPEQETTLLVKLAMRGHDCTREEGQMRKFFKCSRCRKSIGELNVAMGWTELCGG